MNNPYDECYGNINNHPRTRLPNRELDTANAVYVGAKGETEICKLINDQYIAWDIRRDCPLKDTYPQDGGVFCSFDEAIICRGLSSFDF